MMKNFAGLFARLGWKHEPRRPSFALDTSLHTALLDLATREHRPAGEIQADLLTAALAQRHLHSHLYERWQALSPREQQVTALTCLVLTNRQIAARLGVSEETVKTHVHNSLVKFNLHGKSELRIALREWDFSEWDR
jgi:DNA-binding CsgD family transcriptional regulator